MSEVDLLIYLMNDAFAGTGIEESNEAQSLLANLATVDEAMWATVPAGASRSIESIARHVGSCKLMYDEYAFGSGKLAFESPEVEPWPVGKGPKPAVEAWLREMHARLVGHVAELSDSDLTGFRPANWGEMRETRWLLNTLLQHDLYHAGEINHIRSLLDGDDRWRFQQLGYG